MTHFAWIRRRFGWSLRVRLAVLMLALAAFPAVFAEIIAADQPIVAYGPQGWSILPAVVSPDDHAERSAAEIAERYQHDLALWPLIRAGPQTTTAEGPHAEPSWRHPLGTDGRGRDVAARLVHGARQALGLALMVLVFALVVGGVCGALAGYLGGFWDELVTRPVELVQAFPAIIVVAVLRAIDPERSLWSLLLAVAAVRCAEMARLVRAEVIRVDAEEFVAAARALGCTRWRILRRHILPHTIGPITVSLVFGVAAVVVLEVAVSFLGLGQDGSWGVLIAEGLRSEAPAAAMLGGIAALVVTVAAVALLADVLGEVFDARVATTTKGFVLSPRGTDASPG